MRSVPPRVPAAPASPTPKAMPPALYWKGAESHSSSPVSLMARKNEAEAHATLTKTPP